MRAWAVGLACGIHGIVVVLLINRSKKARTVSRHSQDELRIEEYQPYEPRRRYVEHVVRSGFRMGDASEFTESRVGQTYLNLLLDKLR